MHKAGRSHSVGALGGSSSLGTFHVPERGMVKSHSIAADGTVSNLTPAQMGRQELYQLVPFAAVMGMQRVERDISEAFAELAADLDVKEQKNLSSQERELRRSRASMIILDELEFESVVVTTPLVFAILIAAMSQFLVGYNTGVMNAPAYVVFPGHSTVSWSLAVAAFAIGGPFGAIIGGKMADQRGRRGALLIDTWTFLLGGLMQTFALDMFTIIVARFIIGFASGYSSVLVPIYLGELAPPTLRGTLGTLTQFAMVIGILISDLLAFSFATESLWRVLFAVTALTAAAQLLLSPFLLESPRWLLGRDPRSLKARYIIKQLRGMRYDHEVESEVENFIIGGAAQRSESVSQWAILSEMVSHSKLRVLFASSLILQMAQQLCGINAVFYYSTSFFEGVIDNPLVGTTIVGAVNVLATYVALLLMDRCGRRTLILWSAGGMFCSCIIIILALLHYFRKTWALVAVNSYVCFFEIGLGPIPWLIVAEMFDAKYVAVAMSACSQLNWACNFIVGLGFPYMNKYLGPYSFLPFAGVLAATFMFALTVLPETQGTTPEELATELVRNASSGVLYEVNPDSVRAIDDEWRKAMEQIQHEEDADMQNGTYEYGFKPITEGDEQDEPNV
jgi:SP family facilitated glucose transporter-like MFS transporter 3